MKYIFLGSLRKYIILPRIQYLQNLTYNNPHVHSTSPCHATSEKNATVAVATKNSHHAKPKKSPERAVKSSKKPHVKQKFVADSVTDLRTTAHTTEKIDAHARAAATAATDRAA